jgi:hypothetical protein
LRAGGDATGEVREVGVDPPGGDFDARRAAAEKPGEKIAEHVALQ